MPAWIAAAIALASGVVIAAGIVLIGWWMSLPHSHFQQTGDLRPLGRGIWFCINATFGNAC
jgi:hypothetical protein